MALTSAKITRGTASKNMKCTHIVVTDNDKHRKVVKNILKLLDLSSIAMLCARERHILTVCVLIHDSLQDGGSELCQDGKFSSSSVSCNSYSPGGFANFVQKSCIREILTTSLLGDIY